jgi:hypothetical protein
MYRGDVEYILNFLESLKGRDHLRNLGKNVKTTSIEMDLKEVGYNKVAWILVTQDRFLGYNSQCAIANSVCSSLHTYLVLLVCCLSPVLEYWLLNGRRPPSWVPELSQSHSQSDLTHSALSILN